MQVYTRWYGGCTFIIRVWKDLELLIWIGEYLHSKIQVDLGSLLGTARKQASMKVDS